jgi:hypothetical protein
MPAKIIAIAQQTISKRYCRTDRIANVRFELVEGRGDDGCEALVPELIW